jgi:hypothetical protein
MFNRDLSKGSAELLVLTLLDARPRHGYDLGKLIEERTKGQIRFRIGSLYPILFRLAGVYKITKASCHRRPRLPAAGWPHVCQK